MYGKVPVEGGALEIGRGPLLGVPGHPPGLRKIVDLLFLLRKMSVAQATVVEP